MISRRNFATLAGGTLASLAFGGACHNRSEAQPPNDDGRLSARPAAKIKTSTTGRSRLRLDQSRDAILQVPTAAPDAPLPLLVLLHGAGGSGEGILSRLGSDLDKNGVVILAPDSRDSSWDAIRGRFGPDVKFLSRALDRVFKAVSIDPGRVAIGGFSDGATYALSVGLINGDLFSRIIAFSPGFVVEGARHGKPRIFISHGTTDPILPIDRCSRQIVPRLRERGYDVVFREFEGGHTIPADIAREGISLVAGDSKK